MYAIKGFELYDRLHLVSKYLGNELITIILLSEILTYLEKTDFIKCFFFSLLFLHPHIANEM